MKSIELSPDHFTMAEYRFRHHVYEKKDNWFWPKSEEISFTDLIADYFENYSEDKIRSTERRIIAQLYLRNDVNQMSHTRIVTNVEDFIGRIGGIFPVIFAVF